HHAFVEFPCCRLRDLHNPHMAELLPRLTRIHLPLHFLSRVHLTSFAKKKQALANSAQYKPCKGWDTYSCKHRGSGYTPPSPASSGDDPPDTSAPSTSTPQAAEQGLAQVPLPSAYHTNHPILPTLLVYPPLASIASTEQ